MEKLSLLMGVGVVIVIAAIAYSEKISEPETHPGRVTITYWEKWSDFESAAMAKVVDDYNASQDKIYVNYLSVSGVDQKTMLATASGTPPDLAGLFGPQLAQYVQYNAITDLTDEANAAGYTRDKYIPVFYDMCTMNNRLYAFPTTPATVALHYNKRMMAEHGVDPNKPPQTLEELDAMDDKIRTIKDGKVIASGFLPASPGWWPWAWPYYFGGSLFDEKTQTVTANTPTNIKAYKWMAGYSKRYGAQSFQDFKQGFGGFNSFQNEFIDGKVASCLQGVWMANFIQKYNQDMDWGAVPFPSPADKPELKGSSMVDLDIIVVPRGCKHPKEAFEFLKYLESQGPMEKLCLGQKKFSPLAVQSPGFEVGHPNPFIHLFRQMSMQPTVIQPPKTPIWSEYQADLTPLIDGMNNGNETPEHAMKALQEKAEALQNEVNLQNAARKAAGETK